MPAPENALHFHGENELQSGVERAAVNAVAGAAAS
jgi:hypothetical protein